MEIEKAKVLQEYWYITYKLILSSVFLFSHLLKNNYRMFEKSWNAKSDLEIWN